MPEKAFLSEQFHKTQELRTELNPGQRHYLDKLVAKLNKILDGRTKEQMIADKDIDGLEQYLKITSQIATLLKQPKDWGFDRDKEIVIPMSESLIIENIEFIVPEIIETITEFTEFKKEDLMVTKVMVRDDGRLVAAWFDTSDKNISLYFLVAGRHEIEGSLIIQSESCINKKIKNTIWENIGRHVAIFREGKWQKFEPEK